MAGRRSMAHLAIDAGLAERRGLGLHRRAGETLLAGMAGRAIKLVGGPWNHLVEARDIGARRVGRVDDLPVVHPAPLEGVVLQREDLDLAAWRRVAYPCCHLEPIRYSTG